jgi:hypothetical protein
MENQDMKTSDKYVDPTLDWSFKKMFLTPGHEDILKTFLNDVLKGELQVHEIQSVIPVSKDEAHHKSILFDVASSVLGLDGFALASH